MIFVRGVFTFVQVEKSKSEEMDYRTAERYQLEVMVPHDKNSTYRCANYHRKNFTILHVVNNQYIH